MTRLLWLLLSHRDRQCRGGPVLSCCSISCAVPPGALDAKWKQSYNWCGREDLTATPLWVHAPQTCGLPIPSRPQINASIQLARTPTSSHNLVCRGVSSGLILLINIAPRYRTASPSFLKPLQFHCTLVSPGRRRGSACYRLHHTPISCGLMIQMGRRSSHYSQERSRRPP